MLKRITWAVLQRMIMMVLNSLLGWLFRWLWSLLRRLMKR